jgi:hypothetical protein
MSKGVYLNKLWERGLSNLYERGSEYYIFFGRDCFAVNDLKQNIVVPFGSTVKLTWEGQCNVWCLCTNFGVLEIGYEWLDGIYHSVAILPSGEEMTVSYEDEEPKLDFDFICSMWERKKVRHQDDAFYVSVE